jgi:hypothetical protein
VNNLELSNSERLIKVLEYGAQEQIVLYCNGVCANSEGEDWEKSNLEEQRDLLISSFPNRKIVIFNNPTSLGEYYTNSEEQVQKIDDIVGQFCLKIRQYLKNGNQEHIPILAHSHGALITKLTLQKLSFEERKKLDIYSFSGVVMIPKSLGHHVQNFVYKGDMICRNGNDKFDSQERILEKVIKITERSQLNQVEITQALFDQFQEDWYREYQWGTSKIPKHLSTFWSGDATKVQGDDKYSQYASCLRDYDIILLPSPSKNSLETKTLTHLTSDMKQSIASFGAVTDKSWHKLTAFTKVLEEIVKPLLFTK